MVITRGYKNPHLKQNDMKNLNYEQIAKAIVSGQTLLTIGNESLSLPKGQTAGTEMQKLFYARMKAKEIIHALKN